MRDRPCSIFIAIISTAMIASSTSRPSASTSAPSEILCRSMPKYFIAANVIASTSGIDSATTRPVRRPSEKKLTSSTIATAIASVSTNSPTERATARGWSATRSSSRPTGKVFCRRATVVSRSRPSPMMSPPARIETARPSASLPSKRMRGCGGSAKPRRTSATSPRRNRRPFARIEISRIASTESNAPLGRR
jgi:hypothetical protein